MTSGNWRTTVNPSDKPKRASTTHNVSGSAESNAFWGSMKCVYDGNVSSLSEFLQATPDEHHADC